MAEAAEEEAEHQEARDFYASLREEGVVKVSMEGARSCGSKACHMFEVLR